MNLREKPFYLDEEATQWVKATLESLTTEDKVGHLFCVNCKFGEAAELERVYRIASPGACMYRALPLERAVAFTEELRKYTKVPLLIAANLEKGGSGIVQEGTLLGAPLEVAATGEVDMARKLAEVCAAEAKEVGANWSFAPIVDIDSNFRNPITNTRTFGSNPERVRDMGVMYMKTVQDTGIAASIKHFPGDGQDERDQHLVTSVNDMDCEEWDKTYGMIYQACIEQGAMTCMVGHIMLPSYTRHFNPGIKDADILPATLSRELMQGLLRGKLGFHGLIVTDATTMAGFTAPMPRREAVPRSIAAGADMFLFARNFEEDYAYMLDGVRNGILSPARLDEAVTRILALKAALGLHKGERDIGIERARQVVGCAKHQEWARECADKAITLIKEEAGVLPLTPQKYKRILFYPIESDGGTSMYSVRAGTCDSVKERLRMEGFEVDDFVPTNDTEGSTPPTTSITNRYDLIIYLANLATKSNQTAIRIEWAQPMGANCPHYMHEVPTIFISVENPYHLLDVPRIKTFINAYNSNDHVLEQLVEKLMGRSEFKGQSPVDAFCGKWDTRL